MQIRERVFQDKRMSYQAEIELNQELIDGAKSNLDFLKPRQATYFFDKSLRKIIQALIKQEQTTIKDLEYDSLRLNGRLLEAK